MTPSPLPPAIFLAGERANHHPRSLCERWAVARRSPSRGARGAAACGAARAVLATASPCRRTHGGVTHGRRRSAVAARSLGVVRSARRLALSACGRRRGRFLSGGFRRRTALTAPLPAAPRRRFWRRLGCAASHAAAWRSAIMFLWRRRALSARCVVPGGSRSLRAVVSAIASSLGGGRRRAALATPLSAAPRWRS